MSNFRNRLSIVAFSFVAILFIAQAIRIDRTNPDVLSDLTAAPGVKPILQRACYNCHSNETVWPWYSGVAPVSWLVGSDVKEGREHMNFSEWGTYDSGTQSHKLRGISEEVKSGDMPPWYYKLIHGEARLTASERDQILAWTEEAIKAGPQ